MTDPSDISVFLGYDWDKGVCENTKEEIGRVIIHPDYYYAGAGFRNDAALVEILRPAAADPVKILTPGTRLGLLPPALPPPSSAGAVKLTAVIPASSGR